MKDIIWYGRGGQRVTTTARIFENAVKIHGKESVISTIPDSEREGEALYAYTRVGSSTPGDAVEILPADYCIVFDDTLLDTPLPLKPGGTLIVNSKDQSILYGSSFSTFSLDAYTMADGKPGKTAINTVMFGAFVAVTNIIPFDAALEAIRADNKRTMDNDVLLFAITYSAILGGNSL